MADMASFFQNPFIIVVLTALAVVLLLVGFVASKILLNQRLADRRVATVADLAQNFSGDKQMSRAMELARNGAAANELTLATGIGQDEAEAIVKFHGPAKS